MAMQKAEQHPTEDLFKKAWPPAHLSPLPGILGWQLQGAFPVLGRLRIWHGLRRLGHGG